MMLTSRQIAGKGGWFALAFLAFALTGCAGKPFTYHPQQEIPEGPGMFSGEEGGLVLYSDKKKRDAAREAANRAPPGVAPSSLSEDEYREFRQFQEFKRWKETNRDSAEYREFREWQEWKTYRAWRERSP